MIVLVIDSSAIIIERWQLILKETENIRVVYGAVSSADALKLFNEIHPGLVLLDANLPADRSIALLKKIKGTGHQTIVIIMSGQKDDHLQKEFINGGADFFFDKYYEFEKIEELVREIAAL